MSSEKHTFFITGASSGLGLAIAQTALDHGHSVIGTARNIVQAQERHPEFVRQGGEWAQLDLIHADTQNIVNKIVEEKDVDVLVCNAGWGLYGSLEDMSEDEIRDQMETNFFGTVKVIKGAIPYFRTRRKGIIMVMSSISGMTVTSASSVIYSASKFALEGLSEGLAQQLSPFGIKVLIIEPGIFRTNWLAGSYATPAAGLTEDYEGGPIDEILKKYPLTHGKQDGDPQKAAKRIMEVIMGVGMGAGDDVGRCLRLPLGHDAIDKARAHVAALSRNLDIMEDIARHAAYDT